MDFFRECDCPAYRLHKSRESDYLPAAWADVGGPPKSKDKITDARAAGDHFQNFWDTAPTNYGMKAHDEMGWRIVYNESERIFHSDMLVYTGATGEVQLKTLTSRKWILSPDLNFHTGDDIAHYEETGDLAGNVWVLVSKKQGYPIIVEWQPRR